MSDLQVDSARPRPVEADAEPIFTATAGEDRSWRLTCIGGMAAIMAHRLAQPMTAINALATSSLKAVRSPTGDNGKVAENLAKIEQQARRATDMIRSFAQFAHRGAPDIGLVEIDVVVAGTLASFTADMARHDITSRVNLVPNLPRVAANSTAVGQVVSCLVRNAVEAVMRGSNDVRQITVSAARTDDGMIEVSVADTGDGIDPEVAPVLFDPFASERPGECGVGLAVARAIVEALGGRISIKSNDRAGAVVAFALPAERQGDVGERRVG